MKLINFWLKLIKEKEEKYQNWQLERILEQRVKQVLAKKRPNQQY